MVPNQAKPASNPAQTPQMSVCHISVLSLIAVELHQGAHFVMK